MSLWCCFFFFFSRTGTSVHLSGRKETAADPYSEAGAHPHSLTRLLKGCGKTSAFSLKKRAKQLTSSHVQRRTCSVFCTSPASLFLSKRKAYSGSIFEPEGTCLQVPKNAGPANARLTFAFTCPRLNIYPCPYFIRKCRYYLEWSEWRRVSKCFKPCTYSQSKQFWEQ